MVVELDAQSQVLSKLSRKEENYLEKTITDCDFLPQHGPEDTI